MKFLVPNYSCLQNPWLRGYRPQIPVLSVLCPQLNLLNPPRKRFLGTPLARCVLYITNEMQFIQCFLLLPALYMFRAVFPPFISSLQNCMCSLGYCHALYRWCGWDGTGKRDNTQGCTYSFVSSWWWAEKPPETCRALIIIKNIV